MKRTLILSAILLLLLGNLRVKAQDSLTIINNLSCSVTAHLMASDAGSSCMTYLSNPVVVSSSTTTTFSHVITLNKPACPLSGTGVVGWLGGACVGSGGTWDWAYIDVNNTVVLNVAGQLSCAYTASYPYNFTDNSSLSGCG